MYAQMPKVESPPFARPPPKTQLPTLPPSPSFKFLHQKTAEDLEYSELLDQAAQLPPGSMERLLRVAAFAVSPYSSTPGRTSKPFNPLLGETFEYVCPEKGVR